MGKLKRDCPHCHKSLALFSSFAEIAKPDRTSWTTAFFCENCYGGYIAEINPKGSISGHALNGEIDAHGNAATILKEYPLPKAESGPEYLPKNINTFYLQAANSLKMGNLDAAAMMSRKVLEVSVNTIEPNINGSLFHRIEQLGNLGKITEELKSWAHAICQSGNEIAQAEDPVTPEFANELLSFTEMFLMYTFTMPNMIYARRRGPGKDDAND